MSRESSKRHERWQEMQTGSALDLDPDAVNTLLSLAQTKHEPADVLRSVLDEMRETAQRMEPS
jgi:hypothetical protein